MMRTEIALTAALLALVGAGGSVALQTATSQEEQELLSSDEIKALINRAIANQHHNDEVHAQYERIEHYMLRSGGENPSILQDRTFRVVPTGTGTLKLLLKDGSKPVSNDFYRKQLSDWEKVLEIAVDSDDPREQAASAKMQKKLRERRDLVDAIPKAFTASYAGREMRDGHDTVILQLDPNPDFRPRNSSQNVLTHTRARAWIDNQSGQLVRGEAEITRDISFGQGILGKLYKGGHFSLDQAEVELGTWLPVRYQYDYSGRKFLFSFEQHELTEARRYRHIASPKEALAMVRSELRSDVTVSGDP